MQIKRIDGLIAHCEAKGVERTANLLMLQGEELQPGDYLVIHLGHATEKITEERAMEAWAVYDEMLGLLQAPSDHHDLP